MNTPVVKLGKKSIAKTHHEVEIILTDLAYTETSKR